MKKILSLIAITSLLAIAPVVSADNTISVNIDGTPVEFDVPPMIINDRTMVPMRAIFETLGAEVIWDETNETVTAKKNGTEISLKINDNKMTKNGWEIELDAPAILLSDHTMLPLRAVSEAF